MGHRAHTAISFLVMKGKSRNICGAKTGEFFVALWGPKSQTVTACSAEFSVGKESETKPVFNSKI
jgi:hypothetical protein